MLALLQRDMAELNALSGKLRDDLPEPDRAEVNGLVRRVKLKLELFFRGTSKGVRP